MFVKNIKNSVLSIGKKLDSPVFIKDYVSNDEVVEQLESIKNSTDDGKVIKDIEMDQLYIRLGDQGEKNVYYELKNSFVPMYVMHDVRIQEDDYHAQLDYVVITNKFILILETKKLNGNITINNSGDFVRSFKNAKGKTYKKEGMYSPISQNQRHVRIVENLLKKNKLIKYAPVLSLVVMANPKNIINYKYAPKEIKQQIIKYDQLTNYLKKQLKKESDINMPIVTMGEIAEFLMRVHVEEESKFLLKYADVSKNKVDAEKAVMKKPVVEKRELNEPKRTSEVKDNVQEIRNALIAFRREQSKKEGVAAYMIFNNKQLDDILARMPKNKDELMKCSGFGAVKVEKYGDVIVGILG